MKHETLRKNLNSYECHISKSIIWYCVNNQHAGMCLHHFRGENISIYPVLFSLWIFSCQNIVLIGLSKNNDIHEHGWGARYFFAAPAFFPQAAPAPDIFFPKRIWLLYRLIYRLPLLTIGQVYQATMFIKNVFLIKCFEMANQ